MSSLKKFAERIQRVGVVANPEKPSAARAVRRAVRAILRTGREVIADKVTADLAQSRLPVTSEVIGIAEQTQMILVFGGDGTMLRVAREIAGSKTPILGINVGGLGFLTALSSTQSPLALSKIWAGDFVIESRPLIEATGVAHGNDFEQRALNDFVVSRGVVPRLIELEVSVDGEVLTRYRCDGLIISSPTGSTAYSLSAGGAVVCPSAEVFAITPICPHTLSNRSVIVSLDSLVEVRVRSERLDTILTADGQVQIHLAPKNCVQIRRSRKPVRLLHLRESTFFSTLRKKLNWSGSNV